MSLRPVPLQEIFSLVQQMIANPADQVTQAARLREMVRALPPEAGELLSRAVFSRCGLWTLVAHFFSVPEGDETPPEVIRMPRDGWIRGVSAAAIVPLSNDGIDAQGIVQAATQRRAVAETTGSNFRGLFELNWRINSKQGFISSGTSEILGTASLITGNGFWKAPMDWRLQLDDTIEVRARLRLQRLFPTDCAEPSIPREFPWIAVGFEMEELPQPKFS